MSVAEVNAVAQAFHDGVANQDATALAGLYHDDARLLPPNMEPAEGPQAIRAVMQQLLDLGVRSLDIEPIDVREAGDLTIEYGRYTLGIEPEGGEAVTDVGKYVVVHETREAGDLTIEYGRYTLGIEPEGAEAMTDVGKYVVVHESQPDGSTKIVLDIFNSNSPPPA
jgi:uncharacterized protein (TIGR02246 family)